jgi:peptidyl-prolyl cis-trans isomerase D
MVMRQMRENTKVIMLFTALAFVGLMIFGWGMDITGRSNSNSQLGKVNGEAVSLDEYNTAYRTLYEQQQRSTQGPVSATLNKQIEDAAWNQLVMQKLIRQELEDRGIEVTPAEIRQAARYAPPPEFANNQLFLTDGQFDINKYHQFLSSPAVDNQLLLQLEAYYRDVIPRSKLYYQVTSGLYTPDDELWRMWRDETEKASVKYITLDAERMVTDAAVTVSEREISDYYRANGDEFKRPARATARIVLLDKAPSAADTARALERVQRIREQIVSTGNFASIARAESADSASRERGGDLGTIVKGQTVPAFEQAVFSLPLSTLSQPVMTQFGYHLIEVLSRTEKDATARHVLVPIAVSQEHDEETLERADSLEALSTTQALASAAIALGLNMRTVELTQDMPTVAGVGQVDEGVEWAFGEEGTPGEVSQLYETPRFYYILELVSKTPAGVTSLQEATAMIRSKLVADKKLEQARTIGRQMVDQIRSGTPMEQVAAARGLAVQTEGPFARIDFVPGLGQANAAIGTAFGLAKGQTSGVVETPNGLFILQKTEEVPAQRAEFDKQRQFLRQRLSARLAEERWNAFLSALREEADVVDRREEIFARAQELAESGAIDPVTGLPTIAR